MSQKCTLIVNSCDAYSDLWIPFFTLFKMQWPECNMPIILNTESKSYYHKGLNINTLQLYSEGQVVTWSRRLKETLKQIKTPYALLLLDDFFMESVVDATRITQCIEWMEENKNIAVFHFMPAQGGLGESKIYHGFELLGRKAPYRFNCQAAVWRVHSLIKFLREHESAWQFELWGSKRSRRYSEEIYALYKDSDKVFDYDWGKPVIRGVWNKEQVNKIYVKFGIEIDTSIHRMKSKAVVKASLCKRIHDVYKSLR